MSAISTVHLLHGSHRDSDAEMIRYEVNFVTVTCSIITLLIALTILHSILKARSECKSQVSKLKIPMYNRAIGYVMCIFLYLCCISIVPFKPKYAPYSDCVMDVITLCLILAYFSQWSESFKLYVQTKFTGILGVKDHRVN